MIRVDLEFQSPVISTDPEATKQMAVFTARMKEVFQFIFENLQFVEVVSSAPTATQLTELGDGAGRVKSTIKILHDATQTNRKIYYKYQGTAFLIDSA